jgi:3-methyl-2-oxobutanoate hydroxymethyltransferase
MSAGATSERITVAKLAAPKGWQPIVGLTAYSTHMARLLDPHVDLLLVGDPVGMYGFESILPDDDRPWHGRALRRPARLRGGRHALRQLPEITFRRLPECRPGMGADAVASKDRLHNLIGQELIDRRPAFLQAHEALA